MDHKSICAHFVEFVRVNLDNEKLDDKAFREIMRTSIPDKEKVDA